MFDALKLLDQFMGAGTAAKVDQMTGGRIGQMAETYRQGGAGAVFDQAKQAASQGVQNANLGGMLEQAKQAIGATPGTALGDRVNQAQDFLSKNAMASTVVAGALGALLLGTRGGRAVGGTALKLGGLALVGGLAYKALQSWQQGRAPQDAAATGPVTAAPVDSGFASTDAEDAQTRAMNAIKAMIAAAKADGHIDAAERERIVGRFEHLGIDADAAAFIEAEMAAPLDFEAILALADTTEKAIELYAASVVAIDPDTPAERAYLDALAERLSLDGSLRAHLDAQAAAVRAA
jgi:uncharacterized membrane protein YebE (DUF533 family)